MTKVLVIDDEVPMRLVCRINLEAEGIEVIEAGNGELGLELARAERPDVILVDVLLPALDGWQVAERLLADEATRRIPIVFLTALVDPGGEDGGGDVLVKPFDPTELGALVRSVVATAGEDRPTLTAERIAVLRKRFGPV